MGIHNAAMPWIALELGRPSSAEILETSGLKAETSKNKTFGAIIQPEIDNALAGDTVLAKDGVYVEQVEISKDLTLRGAGAGTIVRPPDALAKFFTTSGLNNYPVVYAHDAAAVTIRDLKVDGAGKGNVVPIGDRRRFRAGDGKPGSRRTHRHTQNIGLRGLRCGPRLC